MKEKKNFEKMKRNISDQIFDMNITEFYEFVNFMENQYQYSKDNKRPPYDKIFYHRRPSKTLFTEKVSHSRKLQFLYYLVIISFSEVARLAIP